MTREGKRIISPLLLDKDNIIEYIKIKINMFCEYFATVLGVKRTGLS